MEDIQTSYGFKLTYNKAWRSRENALMAMRGTMEDFYGKLPSYMFMLTKNNPGVSIRGFKNCFRPILCFDVSFLKQKVEGQLLVAIALDANKQLYYVSFGIVDSENNNSWTYFMQHLRVIIGVVPDLVFLFDRHPSIFYALSAGFPEARHGAFTYHIKMNIMAKFKTDNYHIEFDMASRAYIVSQFHQHFDKIKAKDPRIAAYLEQIGLKRWSCTFFTNS
ncbi:uncharacterized protein LOC124915780 [Impatiens glandulifera]|uniref:uncharacterized protein LOC124915780 n=1 Tax=Impatiens glandulifera TaxID=253017 RepID=UPI001FB0F9CA|nr:uncharacterized protein LOC124915780 [Impatiens glandulifera]